MIIQSSVQGFLLKVFVLDAMNLKGEKFKPEDLKFLVDGID